MKKVFFIGAMMLFGTMMFNTVYAQTPEQKAELAKLRGQRQINQAKRNVEATCYDDDKYMAEIGYADGMANRDLAIKNALANCQRSLKLRLEQVVKGVIDDFSSRTELSSDGKITDAELRDLDNGFHSVINKSIGRTIKCYSDVQKNQKGSFDAEYNAKISIDEFIKECETVVESDATLRVKTNMDAFRASFRENFSEESEANK